MAWSGGTFTRTNGVNSGATTWATDAAAAVKIRADRHDTHDQDLATGINQCLNKDGSNYADAINIGNASDTTITRSSAGVIAVEGVTVPLNSITNVHTAQQIELGHASDTTITRAAAGRAQIEGREIVTAAAEATTLTSTIAELNKVDDSVAAVAGFVSGMRSYLNTDGGSTTTLDVDADITENTFESVGPTGSSATNIWTPMDAIPAGAKMAILGVYISGTNAGGTIVAEMYARQTGSSGAVGISTMIGRAAGDTVAGHGGMAFVPLDASNRFDLTWVASGDTARDFQIRLKGFVV